MDWYDPVPMTQDEAVAVYTHLDAETAKKAQEYATDYRMPHRDLPLYVRAAAIVYFAMMEA